MYDKLTILSRRLPLLVAAVALLMAPFVAAPSYADEVPFKASYSGTLVPIPVDYDDDGTYATVLDGQAKGSFGVSMTHIVTEWQFTGVMCHGSFGYFEQQHGAIVLTFSNGDQMFGAALGNGWMCMDVNPLGTGNFYGEAYADLTHGTGRFEGATASFLSPFSGTNITANDFGYGFGPISGTMEGTVVFP
ncbi:MAG: hypothetical protein KJP17_11280 [Gammaproteobacteria bacterium]|nr:hypothetical protein [Gammaproteobacteria bacterium]